MISLRALLRYSLVAALASPALAQAPVRYEIAFPNAVHREGEVTIRFAELPAGPLRVRMSRSSPGRYAIHEFAKNVYAVRADDGTGRALDVERTSPHEWRVSGHRGAVVFRYTLFADRADGTYAGIDETRAHLNIPATFAWAIGLEARPIEVTFRPVRATWRVATQLQPTADPHTFRAPDLAYFLDSPTHLGELDIREWPVTSGGRTQTIRLAVNHLGTAEELTRFTDQVKRVVDAQAAVFGELPAFDFGTYTFIACYRPTCAGDGMEHRNSTSLTSSGSLATAGMGLLGTVSHEFFHGWNVERIRPRDLEPFDFTEANMSAALWLAEGFTSYYTHLTIARAGLLTPAQYAGRLTNPVHAITNTTARRYGGAAAMSQQAPFVDAAVSIDPHNRANTFLSYYTYGEALGLALDLSLRARSRPATLDDFFREMWRRHGRNQTDALAPARPYTLADAEAALAAVAGDAAFARDWFTRYVTGSELPDYPMLLGRAGFLVRPARADAGWIGDVALGAAPAGGLVVNGPTIIGTPLYEAGIASGDRLLTLDGAAIASPGEFAAAIERQRPGERVRLTWEGRAGPRSAELTVRANPRVEVVAFEDAGRTPTAAQLAFRDAWVKGVR